MDPAADTPPTPTSRAVVVAGSGRSGTSTIAGVLKNLGLTIPQPEVPGNRTNPRGFFEPQWAVTYQTRLLNRAQVHLTDGRPYGFERTAEVGARPQVRAEVEAWLREQFALAPEVVVKDPRNSWFLPMWRDGAAAAGGEASFVTMLRHPAEVVGSKQEYYKSSSAGMTTRMLQTTRVGGWVNVALFTEAQTRDARRAFVRYLDLLQDWRTAVGSMARTLDLSLQHGFPDAGAAAVDEFIDPGLHRVRTTWDDIECPDAMRELAEDVWARLGVLADADGSDAEAEAGLDEARARFQAMYADAEAIAQPTIDAVRRQSGGGGQKPAKKAAAKKAAAKKPAAKKAGGKVPLPPPPPSVPRRAVRKARRVASRLRHRVG